MLDQNELADVAASFGVDEPQVRRDHLISHILATLSGGLDSYRGTDAPAGRSRDHPQRSQNRCDAAYGQDGGGPFDRIGYGARIREDEIVGET
jgi:hypothetical protein